MYGNDEIIGNEVMLARATLVSMIIVTIIAFTTIILTIKKKRKIFILWEMLAYITNVVLILLILPRVYITIDSVDGFGNISLHVGPILRINSAIYIIPIIAIIIQIIPLLISIIKAKKLKNKEGETKCQE